jgi:mRNA-degrading endonuclease RelE of RelBE toxin-antitoxin system
MPSPIFSIAFTREAIDDIRQFRKYQRQLIIREIEDQLGYQPSQETRNRKKLRPNQLAEWELRIGGFRVFYDINEQDAIVSIEVIGYKEGSRLFVRGQEYRL